MRRRGNSEPSPLSQIGVIGLGVMGANLARNFASRKIKTLVYNRTAKKTTEFLKQFGGEFLFGEKTLKTFVAGLERPRKIILMVKAGEAVDDMIVSLKPLLQKGDILIDGGNSHYRDTIRREAELKGRGVYFVGCGISGGEEGALHGPSLMPGGDAKAYKILVPFFRKIAAKDFEGKPCVTHLGPDGYGHYVKMVHNAIEYGMMQLIAEAYDVMRSTQQFDAPTLAHIFKRWNRGKLKSFLIETSADALARKDDFKKGYAVDFILDRAEQKGTGQWAAIDALERGIAIPSLIQAVEARVISSHKDLRRGMSRRYKKSIHAPKVHEKILLAKLQDALYAGFWLMYGQGFSLLSEFARDRGAKLNLVEVVRIWQGGCIIRADLLKELEQKYRQKKDFINLPAISSADLAALRWMVIVATAHGIPIPAFSSALAYHDGLTQKNSPANLIQALRDSFGSHTFERIDRPGHFHLPSKHNIL